MKLRGDARRAPPGVLLPTPWATRQRPRGRRGHAIVSQSGGGGVVAHMGQVSETSEESPNQQMLFFFEDEFLE